MLHSPEASARTRAKEAELAKDVLRAKSAMESSSKVLSLSRSSSPLVARRAAAAARGCVDVDGSWAVLLGYKKGSRALM